jgi:gamma-glutamyltranspeptidase / glutathione hydrolase
MTRFYRRFSLTFVRLVWPLAMSLAVIHLPVNAAFPRPATGKKGMVASAHRLATEAGIRILKKGGNAIDAAVATAFAISVTLPYSAGIGGGGFLLLHDGKRGVVRSLDFRERAPLAAHRDMFLDAKGRVSPGASTDGYLSAGVPGTVAGLYEVHRKYGTLPWKTVMEPSIRLAYDGFLVSELYAGYVNWRKDVLLKHAASRAIFTRDGMPLQAGDLLVQRDLAATLARIASDWRDFYDGETANQIAKDMTKNGGLITAHDLKSYKPTWRKPVCGKYQDYDICSMPPPSSGGVHLVQMLNMLSSTNLREKGWHAPETLHVIAESMRIAYADRATHLGDPAFTPVPVNALTSTEYATDRYGEINLKNATPSQKVQAASPTDLKRYESPDTSHLTVVDKHQNVVSLTFTVNYGFGSGVVVPGTGVLLNDEMDDFSVSPGEPNAYGLIGGEANAVAPTKIPLSSMSPTIVKKDGRFRFATGSPGGSTIITTVLQVVINIVDYDMNAAEAVAAPRFHHQWLPDALRMEAFGFDPATKAFLKDRGHIIEEKKSWGNASAIMLRDDGILEGAADPRGEGSAQGH